MTKRKIEYWVIPPNADAEFVAQMEEVLDTYEKAYDPACPVVCMDEQPVQLIGETRVPISASHARMGMFRGDPVVKEMIDEAVRARAEERERERGP